MKANIIHNDRFIYLDSNIMDLQMKEHSCLRFRNKSFLIKSYKKFKKKYEYSVIDTNILSLPRESAGLLIKDDIIYLSIPLYNLSTIMKFNGSEKGFSIGDHIEVYNKNKSPNDTPAILIVESINEKKEIKSLHISSEGDYHGNPEELTYYNLTQDREVKIDAKMFFDSSKHIQKPAIINKIIINPSEVIISLNYHLFEFGEKQSVYIEKYILMLNDIYEGETLLEEECTISSGYTSYLQIPIMEPNSKSSHAIFNEAMQIIDERIKKLEELNSGQ